MDKSEYRLLLLCILLKRLIEFDLPEATREAIVKRRLAWRQFFASDIQGLKAKKRLDSTIRCNYGDGIVSFITFMRNQLVHQDDIRTVYRRLVEFGDPLSKILQALEPSGVNQDELTPAIEAVQVLKLPDSTSEEGLRRLQEFLQQFE
jgi:hypothetical protein